MVDFISFIPVIAEPTPTMSELYFITQNLFNFGVCTKQLYARRYFAFWKTSNTIQLPDLLAKIITANTLVEQQNNSSGSMKSPNYAVLLKDYSKSSNLTDLLITDQRITRNHHQTFNTN